MIHRIGKPSDRLMTLCALLFTILAALAVVPSNGFAQVLPTGSGESGSDPSGLDLLLKEAREDGATVIVVKPGTDQSADQSDERAMNAKQFIRARQRLADVIGSAPTFVAGVEGTLKAASAKGSWFWLLRGIGTAILGLFLASLAIRPIIRWMRDHFRYMYDPDPETTADKAKYLLFRGLLAIVYAGIYFFGAIAVALVLDPEHEPTRRVVFEIVLAYVIYRLLRYGNSWNLFAHDVPTHRLVSLTDEEARSMHVGFYVFAMLMVTFAAITRFLAITATEQMAAGVTGGMTPDHVVLLGIGATVLLAIMVFVFTLMNFRGWQHIFGPKGPDAPFYKLHRNAANLTPIIWLIYTVFSVIAFTYKLLLNEPAPAAVVFAPYIALWGALILYGIVLVIIQAFYNRRQRLYEERVAAERARLAEEAEHVDTEAGEEMIVGPSSSDFEYQPVFRSFFETGALAVIVTVALGELGRAWGVPVGAEGNMWAGFLDIVLTAILCWLAYRAVCIFIDRRMEEEGGVPEQDEEAGGEGGGAGASRMATLLPIIRYILIAIIFSVAVMVVLSRLGVDVGPLFAGAGVVGIAVGFGAQKLIADIFSGAFFLLDDAFRKGEYVEIEGVKGVVEKISIRSFQLRHHLGALHTIPFGEIKQLTNYSRDWVLMKLPLRVTYDTDVEKVRKLVKKLGQQLLEHPQVGHTFMQPLKSQGVYKMEDSAMIIRVKFMTKPGEQFVTRKVVYEAIQDLFAREGIKFAHKEVTVRLADGAEADRLTDQEKQAVASAARSVIDQEEAAMAGAEGAATDDR